MNSNSYNAMVIGKIQLTQDLMILRVRTDEPRSLFKAGQYIKIGLHAYESRSSNSVMPIDKTAPEKLISRPYYIASVDSATNEFEFYISQVKSGQLTPRLFNLSQGKRIWLDDKILGVFDINSVPDDKNLLMIATGTGLSPYISFLRSHIKEHKNNKIVIIHGAAYRWDLGYLSELNLLNEYFENFSYHPTLIKADESWNGLKGYIENHIESQYIENNLDIELSPDKTHVFLCGNPKMVSTVLKYLKNKGYDENCLGNCNSLHVEQYTN